MTHFMLLRPWQLCWIVPMAIVSLLLWRGFKRKTTVWTKYCDAQLLQQIAVTIETNQRHWRLPIIILMLLSLVIAIGGPSWRQQQVTAYRQQMAQVVVLDLSNNMNATDVPPSRLTIARYKLISLLNQVNEGQTGMIVFSKLPFVVSPLTTDTHTINAMIPSLSTSTVPVQGSNIRQALLKAKQLIGQAQFNHGKILLMTASAPTKKTIITAKHLASEGYSIAVWAIGTEQGGPVKNAAGNFTKVSGQTLISKVNIAALHQLADAGHGLLISTTSDNKDIIAVKQWLTEHTQTNVNKTQYKLHQHRDDGHWLIWLAMILLWLVFPYSWLEQ